MTQKRRKIKRRILKGAKTLLKSTPILSYFYRVLEEQCFELSNKYNNIIHFLYSSDLIQDVVGDQYGSRYKFEWVQPHGENYWVHYKATKKVPQKEIEKIWNRHISQLINIIL